MNSLFWALLALGTTSPAVADPCAVLVPRELERELELRFPDTRLPLATDSDEDDRQFAAKKGDACLLIARADVDGDGRLDLVLLLPSKTAGGYRLVVALNKPAGFKVSELGSWMGSTRNLYVDVASPGTYRHTDAYPFHPAPGVVERIDSTRPGFYFGKLESAADVYFLNRGQWSRVHVLD